MAITVRYISLCGQGSVLGTAFRYGLDGRGQSSVLGTAFRYGLDGRGQSSVLGTAFRSGLVGPRLESRLGRDSSQPSRQGFGFSEPPIQQVRSLPAGKAARAWRSQPTPHLTTRLKKEYSYTYTPPLGLHRALLERAKF